MDDLIFWLLLCVLSLSIGSFINVVVYRLPLMVNQPCPDFSLSRPASHCPRCQRTLGFYDRVPLLSWLMLRGRCRTCRQAISWHYPAVELCTLVIAILLALWLPRTSALPVALALSAFLLALTLIDLRCQLLPDALTQPLLWLGLLLQAAGLLPATPAEAITGAICGFGLLYVPAEIYRLWRKREALGGGDARLLAALGAWLGWQSLPLLLLIASGTGLAVALMARLLTHRPLNLPLPFGPYLALAGQLLLIGQLTDTCSL